MDFYRPIHYLFGECRFCVPKRDFARLANIFAVESLSFRAERDSGDDDIFFRTALMESERASELAGSAGIEITLLEKKGLPFKFIGYKKRFGLIIGLFLGLALLFSSQLFVWKITVDGNEEVPDGIILASLADCGVDVGRFIPRIDPLVSANELLLSCDGISSAAITIKGTHLTVSVLERAHPPAITDTAGYYNIVATRDGVIVDVDAADGTPEVSEGDAVYEGQLLINSFIEGQYGSFRPTHARGTVLAEVKEHFEAEVPFERYGKSYTGGVESKKVYRVLGREIPAYFSEDAPYDYFDVIDSEKNVTLFGFIELPIKVSSMTYYEYEPELTLLSSAEAETIAREELDGYLAEFDCEVAECRVDISFDEEKGVCLLKADALLIMDIAKEIPLKINDYGTNISEILPSARE